MSSDMWAWLLVVLVALAMAYMIWDTMETTADRHELSRIREITHRYHLARWSGNEEEADQLKTRIDQRLAAVDKRRGQRGHRP